MQEPNHGVTVSTFPQVQVLIATGTNMFGTVAWLTFVLVGVLFFVTVSSSLLLLRLLLLLLRLGIAAS